MVIQNLDWIINKLADIEVYLLPDDMKLYHSYVSKMSPGSKIIDLGTGWGKSVLTMALSNPDVDIWTIDTAEHPIANGFAKDQYDYMKNIRKRFDEYGAFNIYPILNDVMQIEVPIRYFDMLSVDLHLDREQEALRQWYPSVKYEGLIFARNYVRYPELTKELFKNDTLLNQDGRIQVYQRNG